MKILVPETIDVPGELHPLVHVERYDPHTPIPAEHLDAEAIVTWGNGPESLESIPKLTQLRWLQALSAGVDHVLSLDVPEGVIVTSGSGLHDRTVTEHATALALTLLRRMSDAAAAQERHEWSSEIGGVQPLRPADRVTSFIDANVLVWGFGNIGQNLARVLTLLGANVRGVARSAGERGGFPVIAEGDIDEALGDTDVLVMVLPSTDATHHALGAARLAKLPRHAYLVNVGRGSTVDETALAAALRSGEIAGAAIDVTETEPLPESSALWDTRNLIITPHAAGGRPDGAAMLIRENLHALLAGTPLRNVVER
ncbi:phosphoglycerate dehydrogenase [Microbacterium sorbitolivorans]|uniref:Phosphoglycerate dehydrogenase n=1 Tax=Microbacterium sorbitolivorans TaxID=1867410 RepID=A0A367XZP8_9MICO|nr:NAD(P)-dependent oxidoreductase [Microbacterium sorbitolivorans]RCK58251.1 phosphoglycerate dehydrogenase [Microbacterium sorbitolivorans]GGF38725.1 phosphoglycerate dehydrogenase [Microbacterium sorbitolivorans]